MIYRFFKLNIWKKPFFSFVLVLCIINIIICDYTKSWTKYIEKWVILHITYFFYLYLNILFFFSSKLLSYLQLLKFNEAVLENPKSTEKTKTSTHNTIYSKLQIQKKTCILLLLIEFDINSFQWAEWSTYPKSRQNQIQTKTNKQTKNLFCQNFYRNIVRAFLRYQCCCEFAEIDYNNSVGKMHKTKIMLNF